ncbi:MAG: SAM-dependent methyltransferase [Pseudomonadota bacterium]
MSKVMPQSPSEAQLSISHGCSKRIKDLIQEQGAIGFDQYMQIALYDPEFGYYQGQSEIFGAQGDFTTAAEISSHLAYCLAHACAKLIHDDANRVILEIGAGSGKLSCEILKYLATWKILPKQFYIYETSAALRVKQRIFLQRELPDYIENIQWLSDLSGVIETVIIIANEVLDALPVKCFQVQSQNFHERAVALNDANEFVWCLIKANEQLDTAFDFIAVMLDEPFTEGYQSEINLNLESTLASWSSICQQCVMFLIDYGYPRHEYYHPQRNMGTLRSYLRHQVSEDVFTYPGLQDITADVDFSAVAKIADYLQMGVLAFSSQRNFMLANHLLEWQPSANSEVERLAQIAQLKQLTLGSAMSERFQVMVLGKGIDYGADRFTTRDMRARL